MKLSIEWLNQYLDKPVDADEAAEILTAQGFPEEGRESAGDDTVLDVEVTSNRGDCLSHVGCAREVAAGSDRNLKAPEIDLPEESGPAAADEVSVTIEADDQCPWYTARVIRGVKVGPSPQWLVDRLAAIGVRSVNNVVDITNYVLMELGQPLHAFDLAKLDEPALAVRRSGSGAKFEAIDETSHELPEGTLVIASGDSAVAVAGVMGGKESEVTDETTDIVLESAIFDPVAVRTSSRALKLASDSSYRFERGVDPEGVERASRRAVALILELAGGTLAEGVVTAGSVPASVGSVAMEVERVNGLLGLDLKQSEVVAYLAALELAPTVDGSTVTCEIPSFRLDLQREVDLVEEVARMVGFGNVPVQEKMDIVARPLQMTVRARRELDTVLVGHGYHETVTFGFLAEKYAQPFAEAGDQLARIDDERRKSEPILRPSLLPSLLACRKGNQDVGNERVRLFEQAATWRKRDGKLVEERHLALLADVEDDAQTAIRDLRTTLEELVDRLAGDVGLGVTPDPDSPETFDAAALLDFNGERLGRMGLLARPTLKRFGLQGAVVAAELDFDLLTASYPPARTSGDLARYPGIERDLSIVVEESIRWSQIASAVEAVAPKLMEGLEFVGTYRGKPIEKGYKSVSLRMVFRDPQQTLRHEQVDPQVAQVLERLKKDVDAQLRGD